MNRNNGAIMYKNYHSVQSRQRSQSAESSFQVSAEIIGLWILQNLCQYLAAGIAVGSVADGMTVRVSTELEASADRVWERLLEKKTFLYLILSL